MKPDTIDGYTDRRTADCERVLVTLLRGLGPWKDSVYLVGGLTPRYLVPARPPQVPAYAGPANRAGLRQTGEARNGWLRPHPSPRHGYGRGVDSIRRASVQIA